MERSDMDRTDRDVPRRGTASGRDESREQGAEKRGDEMGKWEAERIRPR